MSRLTDRIEKLEQQSAPDGAASVDLWLVPADSDTARNYETGETLPVQEAHARPGPKIVIRFVRPAAPAEQPQDTGDRDDLH